MLNLLTMQDIRTICPSAYNFLRKNNPATLPDGRYDLEDGTFINVATYKAKDRTQCRFESHLRYADLQFIVEGSEIIEVRGIESLIVSKPYDEKADITFYQYAVGEEYRLTAGKGLLLLPKDGHMPGIAADSEKSAIKKVVVKIPVDAILRENHAKVSL